MTGPAVEFPKWPHLENHYKYPAYLAETAWITVTEKIHGFNARFGRTLDDIFWIGSRNQVIDDASEPLQGFTDYALTMAEKTPPGYTFFGEWCGPGVQKGIDYGPHKRFLLFGVMLDDKTHQNLLDWSQIMKHADRMGLETVPVIFDGPPTQIDGQQLLDWAVEQSDLSEDEREGVCVGAWPPAFDIYGHIVIVKVKNPKFAERASDRKPKAEPPDLTNVTAFCEDYVTEERLHHVIDLVSEAVNAPGEFPEYTGNVLKTFYEDVIREGAEDYAKLEADDQKQVGKVLNRLVKPLLDAYRLDSTLLRHTHA